MYDMNGGLPGPLHCPCCGSDLDLDDVFESVGGVELNGVLRCACYRYPLLEGIPILRQTSPTGSNLDPVVSRLQAGDVAGAIDLACGVRSTRAPAPRGRWGTLADRAKAIVGSPAAVTAASAPPASAGFRQALYNVKPSGYADYLYYRHGNNSFMAAAVLVRLLRDLFPERAAPDSSRRDRPTLLDLSCGIGHASFLAGSLFPRLRVVAADWDFANLRLARRFICPEAAPICLDAELPLPFADDSLDACLCLDGLHYIRSKVALLAELDRVLRHDAIWLFPHLHNALQHNVACGVPLAPEHVDRLLGHLPHSILSEPRLLAEFAESGRCDLGDTPALDALRESPRLAAVATRRPDFFRLHTALATTAAPVPGVLGWNPVWEVTSTATGVRLEPRWPSEALREECVPARDVLPASLVLDRPTLIRTGMTGEPPVDAAALEALIRRFVVVELPRGYREEPG